jgi:hypothetical protein
MAEGGTSFWKIFFGVLAGIVVAGTCAVGGCLFLVSSAAVNVAKSQQEQAAYKDRVRVAANNWTRERDYCYVNGAVNNNGDRTVTYWKVTAKFTDASGAVIDTGYTNSAERLAPGESKTFRIMQRCDGRYKGMGVTVDEVRIETR